MRKSNIAGPVFISIGDAEKLQLFLENNPKADPTMFLVDGYTFDAYNSMGFGKLMENREATKAGAKKMRRPRLSFARLKAYLKNVARLSPIPKGSLRQRRFPEGVTRLGGTLGVKRNDVVYAYADGVPGDYPNPAEVIDLLT
mmetsp:Transcript_21974/g.37073  ORF Transcript_21974/g.37073 Transcript_21974/m.37073 type:complete len:142 (+) Transcript_21974:339-764(+)